MAVRTDNKNGYSTRQVEKVELDNQSYDLLRADTLVSVDFQMNTSILGADLSTTVDAFANRIQRKKKEKAEENSKAQQEASTRQGLLLEALMNIRRSLAEVARLNLGERFEFIFDVDDCHGWPRLTIRLLDNYFEDIEYPYFQVHAYDRNGRGTIEIMQGELDKPTKLPVHNEADLSKLPVLLKKAVRSYLDLVGDIVLKAENSDESDHEARFLQQKSLHQFQEQKKDEQGNEITGDLFEEDFQIHSLDRLPSLDALDALPEVITITAPSQDTPQDMPQHTSAHTPAQEGPSPLSRNPLLFHRHLLRKEK